MIANQIERRHFSTSRELDFLSQKELVAQTGHQIREWPLVILKELVDNALDACEEGHAFVIDAATEVGIDLNRLVTGFLLREFGQDSFRVQRFTELQGTT